MDRRKDVVLEADVEEVGGIGHLTLHFVIDDALEEEGGGGVGEVLGTDTPTLLLEVRFLEKRTQGGIEIDGAQVLVVNGIRGGEGVGGVVAGGEGIHVVPAGGGGGSVGGSFWRHIIYQSGTYERLRFSILKNGSRTGYLSPTISATPMA